MLVLSSLGQLCRALRRVQSVRAPRPSAAYCDIPTLSFHRLCLAPPSGPSRNLFPESSPALGRIVRVPQAAKTPASAYRLALLLCIPEALRVVRSPTTSFRSSRACRSSHSNAPPGLETSLRSPVKRTPYSFWRLFLAQCLQ